MRTVKKRHVAVLIAIITVLTALAATAVAAAGSGAEHQTVDVNWHPQQSSEGNTGPVDGASAKLMRTDNGVSYSLKARALQAGHAYTLWVVVVDNPAACANQPCTGGDVIGNPATEAQVFYGTGAVAGASGRAGFAGSVSEGPLEGWLPDRTLTDARSAEIHLVLNDHGTKLPDHMPDMIQTYRGGCADSSPFPGIFPPTAIGDGSVGPNTCLLYQSAIFVD
jgi:hypothetical protein